MSEQLPTAPLPDDVIDRVAREVALEVKAHIEMMYPDAAQAVAWKSASKSIQGVIRNRMAAAGRAAESGRIELWLKEPALCISCTKSEGAPEARYRYPRRMARLAKTETFEHTINGVLRKRSELFNEAERIRDRLAEIRNDISALDRTLATLGFQGDLDAMMPRQKRNVIFGKGELTDAIVRELKRADGPLRSRDIARELIVMRGEDARDQKYLSELTRRVSKALRCLRASGEVRSKQDRRGNMEWEWCNGPRTNRSRA